VKVTDIYYSFFKSFEAGWADFSGVNPFPKAGLVVDVATGEKDTVAVIRLTEADRTVTSLFIFKGVFGFFSEED